jgi:hypothetical protein
LDNKLFRYNTEIKIVQSSIKKLNPQFSLCDVLVCYHGDNRNMTSLPKKVIEDNLYSIYGIPIVGEWIYKLDGTDEKSWGSHGGRIILDDKGIHFEQTTKPFGFVSKEAADNASWITITEKDGHTKNEYLKLSGCILWTDRYEESKTILDDNFGQSMEIEFKKGHYRDDHYYEAEEFIFSALCILGTDCEPCFESACISRHYELDSFKKEFSLMLDEYRKSTTKPNKEEKKFMDLKKFTEILSTVKIGESDVCKYRLLNVTDSKVFALDMENYKPYGFDYAVTNETDVENIVIDFNSKVEMSLSATDKITDENFEEFDIKSVIDTTAASMAETKTKENTSILETEFNNKMEEMKTAYEDVSNSYSVAMKKIEEYEAKENEAKAEQHKADIDALFEKYSEKLGKCAEFLVYKAKINPADVTLDEVSEKLTLMVGKFTMDSATKKNFSYNPTEAGVAGKRNETNNKYGHLLDKYMK